MMSFCGNIFSLGRGRWRAYIERDGWQNSSKPSDDDDQDEEEENTEPRPDDAAPIGPLLSPVIHGWRGLAHYRTWSRRRVLERDPEERTSSELYLLEEVVTDVKFICDLPLALRLEICKKLIYEKHEAGHKIFKQADKGSTFYIIFTGSVKFIVNEIGVQEDKTWIIPSGKWFGDAVLERPTVKREATAITNEKTELMVLSKRDYDKVLDIKPSKELKERVGFLRSIPAFQNTAKQSLKRLANVLSTRTYSKNRVITFQGDEAVEMFFITSGECRIILEVHSEKLYTPLPRASSFLKQYWPTSHHRCKMEPADREKDWWHPSLDKRRSSSNPPQTPRTSRCQSTPMNKLPSHLGSALLRSPDMIFQLVKKKKKKSVSFAERMNHGCSTQCNHRRTRKRSKRKPSAGAASPSGRRKSSRSAGPKRSMSIFAKPRGSLLTRKNLITDNGISAWGSPKGSIEALARSGTLDRRDSAAPPFPSITRGGKCWPFVGGPPHTTRPRSRSSLMQIHFSDCYGMKRPKKHKYSLRLFLRDCEKMEKENKKAEFTEKEHQLWQLGVKGEKLMPGVVGEDNQYYQRKFQRWAKHILNREKRLLSYNVIAHTPADPSFMPGIASSAVMKLQRTGPTKRGNDGKVVKPPRTDKDATVLDIGSLHAGQYFGERGLITNTKRAASIVAVTTVETLVLTKWDFHRHCDRNIIKILSSNEYKKEGHLFKQYLKTRKWERYKRTVVDEVMQARRTRIRLRVGPRAVRVLPKPNGTKYDLPKKEWLY